MQIAACFLGLAALVAGHGYVDNATIGGTYYQFYQPYQDPYTSPTPQRISRPVQGNGPVESVDLIDVQCGGYTAGGISGSTPAALHATAAAGSTVTLRWTLWPDSHVGPVITYMARCPDTGCQAWQPGTSAVWFKIIALHAAYSYPGAQFYPGCHQLQVTGSGTKTATSLVAIPGAYKSTDPGITYDAYKAQTYTIPGPAVFTC
ncbi:glycosyl hydrolase family 61 [Colletotrichum fioriniae PJ7]|uniref:lytic cellulose monooxygenase (C4-dehydrogenating) n=1 Tax=Colletotrichum fioriniae PJ7 TaxID=1445577 RepID=A0A010QAJ1_9PEZI|nr:glycosyl hydrolase family 61 [Colletotrichum fioriniae PJ7]